MNARTEVRRRAEEVAEPLPPLLVAAERVASIVAQGVHGRRRVGQGESFWQFRHYEPGDAAQAIDWRQSAKRERVFVRENEWEAAQSVWLWRDGSASMDYRSAAVATDKRERAELLLLALAVLLVRGGEHVALLGTGASPRTGRFALDRITEHLVRAGLSDGGEGAGLPAFEPLPSHARLVVFGDFLAPLERIDESLRRLAARGIAGHVVQVLDPAEETLPFRGRRRFEGLEGEASVLVRRAERVRGEYTARLAAQRAGLAAIARAIGWNFTAHRTDRSPESALLSLYVALAGETET